MINVNLFSSAIIDNIRLKCHRSRTVIQLFFIDMVIPSISGDIGARRRTTTYVLFSFDESQRNVYESSAFI